MSEFLNVLKSSFPAMIYTCVAAAFALFFLVLVFVYIAKEKKRRNGFDVFVTIVNVLAFIACILLAASAVFYHWPIAQVSVTGDYAAEYSVFGFTFAVEGLGAVLDYICSVWGGAISAAMLFFVLLFLIVHPLRIARKAKKAKASDTQEEADMQEEAQSEELAKEPVGQEPAPVDGDDKLLEDLSEDNLADKIDEIVDRAKEDVSEEDDVSPYILDENESTDREILDLIEDEAETAQEQESAQADEEQPLFGEPTEEDVSAYEAEEEPTEDISEYETEEELVEEEQQEAEADEEPFYDEQIEEEQEEGYADDEEPYDEPIEEEYEEEFVEDEPTEEEQDDEIWAYEAEGEHDVEDEESYDEEPIEEAPAAEEAPIYEAPVREEFLKEVPRASSLHVSDYAIPVTVRTITRKPAETTEPPKPQAAPAKPAEKSTAAKKPAAKPKTAKAQPAAKTTKSQSTTAKTTKPQPNTQKPQKTTKPQTTTAKTTKSQSTTTKTAKSQTNTQKSQKAQKTETREVTATHLSGLPVSRRYVVQNRRNVVNMFNDYLNSKNSAEKEKLANSLNTIIKK